MCLFLQLASIGCPNEESYRRELREMLFTSPGIENYISGVVSTQTVFCMPALALAPLCCRQLCTPFAYVVCSVSFPVHTSCLRRRCSRTPACRFFQCCCLPTSANPSFYCAPQILFEETLFQNASDGTPFVKMLQDKGIIPGIKVSGRGRSAAA